MTLALLYRDDDVLVVDKPSGLAVHRGMSRDRVTLVDLLRDEGAGEVHVAHRLDRGTSGALVVARSPAAARALADAFAGGGVHKEYLALVRGEAPLAIHVDHPVPTDEGAARAPAQTDVERLLTAVVSGSPLREPRYSVVLARPHTGRFHQVRRHLKHLGHPIVGDTNYGRSEHNRLCAERFGLFRLALHAMTITFPQPSTGALVSVRAPLPEDLALPLERMGFTSLSTVIETVLSER